MALAAIPLLIRIGGINKLIVSTRIYYIKGFCINIIIMYVLFHPFIM